MYPTMNLKKIFLILTALVAFSSALTAVSDYEYLLGKYRTLKKIAEEELLSAEKKAREKTEREAKKVRMMKNAEYLEMLDAYLAVIPGKDYLMMKTELNQKQWQTVMENNPSNFKGDDLPVEEVSWINA